MTEQDWIACAEPARMLDFLLGQRDHRDRAQYGFPVSDHKLRLFACACGERHGDGKGWREWADKPKAGEFSPIDGARFQVGIKVGQHHEFRLSAEQKITASDLLRHIFDPWSRVGSRQCERCKGTGSIDTGPGDYGDEYIKCTSCTGGWLPGEPLWIDTAPSCEKCGHPTLLTDQGGVDWYCKRCYQKQKWDDRWCRKLSTLPAHVLELAQAVYDGGDCFALHDALLDCGRDDLAKHFAAVACGACEGLGWVWNDTGGNVGKGHCLACNDTGVVLKNHPKGCAWIDSILGKE